MVKIHRDGLTKLTPTQDLNKQPLLNIVLIHGLRGHPYRTWAITSKATASKTTSEPRKQSTVRSALKKILSLATDKEENNRKSPVPDDGQAEVYWPGEFLSADFPDAIIWLYGYESDVAGFFEAKSKNSISQHGQDLFVRLERDIDNELPFVFIVHSLGGIILKDALRRSDSAASQRHRHTRSTQRPPQSENTLERTRHILFLGTPHRGSESAGWGKVMTNLAAVALQDANKDLLRSLTVNSEVLNNIHDQFKDLLFSKYEIDIHSFQESRGMSGVKGVSGKVVDDYSSKLDFPSGIETVETIRGDHRQMAKFSSKEDQGYRAIASILARLLKNMPQPVIERSALDTAHVQEHAQVRNIRSAIKPSSSTKLGGAVDNFGVQGSGAVGPFLTASGPKPRARGRIAPKWPETNDPYAPYAVPRSLVREVDTPGAQDPDAQANLHPSRNRIFEVPLPTNTRFTGQGAVLGDMHRTLKQARKEPRDNVVVLVGLGGCGKTEVALQFSYTHRSQFFGVFWIDATSNASVSRSMSSLRHEISLLPAVQHEARKSAKMKRGVGIHISSYSTSTLRTDICDDTFDLAMFLHRASQSTDPLDLLRNLRGFWLLVVDNMDDPSMLPFMQKILPSFVEGMIIVTTRNRGAAKLGRLIDFPIMSTEDSMEFLLRSIDHRPSMNSAELYQAQVLADRLGNLPLAINQAAAFINFRQWSIGEYLALLEKEPDYLLDKSSEDRYSLLQTDRKYDTVLKTWELSFRHLQNSNTAATDLLQLLAFLHYADIGEQMFTQAQFPPSCQWSSSGNKVPFDTTGLDIPAGLQSCLGHETKFSDALGQLLNFSLVKRKRLKKQIWIHPLVHWWAFARLSIADRSRWLHIAFVFLSNNLPLEEQWPVLKSMASPTVINNHIQLLSEKALGIQLPQASRNVVSLVCAASYPKNNVLLTHVHDYIETISKQFQDPILNVIFELWTLVGTGDLDRGLRQWRYLKNYLLTKDKYSGSGMLNALQFHFAFELITLFLYERLEDLAHNHLDGRQQGEQHIEALMLFVNAWDADHGSYMEQRAGVLKKLFLLTQSRPDKFIVEYTKKGQEASQLQVLQHSREKQSLLDMAILRLCSPISADETLEKSLDRTFYLLIHSRHISRKIWRQILETTSHTFERFLDNHIKLPLKAWAESYLTWYDLLSESQGWEESIGAPVDSSAHVWEETWQPILNYPRNKGLLLASEVQAWENAEELYKKEAEHDTKASHNAQNKDEKLARKETHAVNKRRAANERRVAIERLKEMRQQTAEELRIIIPMFVEFVQCPHELAERAAIIKALDSVIQSTKQQLRNRKPVRRKAPGSQWTIPSDL